MTMRPFDILIAEDNEDDILLIREAFEEVNMVNRLAVVRDGEEALAYLRGEGPFKESRCQAWYCSTSICRKRPASKYSRQSRPNPVFAPFLS